jgi:hypothetical protein
LPLQANVFVYVGHGADGGSNDLWNNSRTKMKTELGKQLTGDEGADNSDDNVAK